MATGSDPQFNTLDVALVIGGTGFIGSHLIRALQSIGVKVRVFARLPFRSYSAELTNGLTPADWFTGDICDTQVLAPACEGVDVVFHLSGIADISSVSSAEIERVNVDGVRAVAEVCARNRTQRLVYFSSALAAEPTLSVYARSKRQAENILLDTSDLRLAGVHLTILRPTHVYGRGMHSNVAAMIAFIKKRHLPPLPKLNNRLTLISVKDTCRAALLAATRSHVADQIFELNDGETYTPSSIESAVFEALGRKTPSWQSPRMLFYIASLVAEILNKLGIWRNDFGLRTYRNLVADRPMQVPANITDLGFSPSQTFHTSVPEIVECID